MKSIFLILCLALVSYGFEPIKVGDIKLSNKTYKNSTIVSKEKDGVKIMHEGGPARINYELLPTVLSEDILKEIGPFDRVEAIEERERKRKLEEALDKYRVPYKNRETKTREEILEHNFKLDQNISRLRSIEKRLVEDLKKYPVASADRNRAVRKLNSVREQISKDMGGKLSLPISKEEIEKINK